jgi:hypothetical protein
MPSKVRHKIDVPVISVLSKAGKRLTTGLAMRVSDGLSLGTKLMALVDMQLGILIWVEDEEPHL